MIRIVVILALAGCYLRQLPVTEQVARASTYTIAVQLRGGSGGVEMRGDAWAIDEHHLVTAGAMCDVAENIALLVDHGVMPVLAHIHGRLCLLDVPASVHLGPPMVLARMWHGHVRYFTEVGSPTWSKWGVVGVVLILNRYNVAVSVGRAELEADLRALGVTPTIAPPLSDVDMDISCQGDAKAHGMCSEFEPTDAEEWLKR